MSTRKLTISCVLLLLVFVGVKAQEKSDSKKIPPEKPASKGTPDPAPRRPKVLTNEDFPSGREPKSEKKLDPVSIPESPPQSSSSSTPPKEKQRALLRVRAKTLQLQMQIQEAQIAEVKKRLDELHEENRPVTASEIKPGKTYISYKGPFGHVMYVPIPTDEEQQLKSRLDSLQVESTRTELEWEALLEDARRAGFTIQQVLDEKR